MMARTPHEAAIDRCAATLLDQGYCIVPHAVPTTTIEAIAHDLDRDFAATPFGQGGFYGEKTKRFGRLLARSPGVAALVGHTVIQGTAERVLSPWCDCLQLNVAQAIAVHPGAPAQMPHRDQDMWRIEAGRAEYLLNVIWPLGRFGADNGATLVWPRSHGASATSEPVMDAVVAEMEPGSALLFLGSTLHGAGANESADERRAIVVGYALGWLKPYENQWLAYPPDIARTFPPEIAALVGYRQHRPNLGNFEGQCPSVLLHGARDTPRGAIDALRPDQSVLVEAFVAEQMRRP